MLRVLLSGNIFCNAFFAACGDIFDEALLAEWLCKDFPSLQRAALDEEVFSFSSWSVVRARFLAWF